MFFEFVTIFSVPRIKTTVISSSIFDLLINKYAYKEQFTNKRFYNFNIFVFYIR